MRFGGRGFRLDFEWETVKGIFVGAGLTVSGWVVMIIDSLVICTVLKVQVPMGKIGVWGGRIVVKALSLFYADILFWSKFVFLIRHFISDFV